MRIPPAFLGADALGVRLEVVGGRPGWEPHPSVRHQRAIDRIRATIQSDGCVHYRGIYVSFPDGSLKRPDISIFCREPDEQEEAVTLVPEAVIEVVSKGHEAKDLEIGPNFYLSQGVKDVVVFDPSTLLVLHVRRDGVTRNVSPQVIDLECGCRAVV